MATQPSVMYSDSFMQTQCGLIDEGQIVHVNTSESVPAELNSDHGQVVVQPARLLCRIRLGPWTHIDGWVYLKSPATVQKDSNGDEKYVGREFNTLFIPEHDEIHQYFKVNRNTSIGREFEVARCTHGRSKRELLSLGRRSAHMTIDPEFGPCCCCDFTLQKDDVVQVIGEPRADRNSCRCGGAGACSRGGHCGGQQRLQVAGHLSSNAIGWISEEKEHVLGDDVREILHKSKLNIAQVWAIAHAEAEDFRRAERLFKGIKEFEEITALESAVPFHLDCWHL